MRRLFIAMLLGCMIFFTGCHADEKQSHKIQDKMENSAFYEKIFISKQDDLNDYSEKEESIYDDLVDLDIQEDEEAYQQKIDEADTFLEKQEDTIEEAEDSFQKAFEVSSSIEGNIEEINDENQKEKASELLDVMKERKKHITTFFDHYEDQLELLHSFYDQLEEDESHIDQLDDKIQEINEHREDMEDLIEDFNQDTKAYNKTENDYYKTADSA